MNLAVTVSGNDSEGNTVNVSDVAFGRDFNEALVHQVVTAYLAGARQGSVAQKNRSQVKGGGRKPWRQKGTGRARAGTIRSPLWRGGGKAFPARPQDYSQKVNRKMYRGAIRAILSEMIRQNLLILVEEFALAEPRTKLMVEKLAAFDLKKSVLVVVSDLEPEQERNIYLASRNLEKVDVLDVRYVNPVSLISYEKVVITVSALKKLEEMLV